MTEQGQSIHVEPFYYWLINFLPHNYYIWRCIVWGTAAILLIATFKRLGINATSAGLLFPLLLLQQFTVTRGCLGIALFLYAISFLFNPAAHKYLSYIFAIIGCGLSLFLHQSLPLFVIIAILALIPINKSVFILSVLLFPVIRAGIVPYVFDVLSSDIIMEDTASFAQRYFEADKSVANINGILRLCLEYVPRILIIIVLVKEYVFGKIKEPKYIVFLFKYSYILFYIALLFLGQEISSFISSRTIHIMSFSLTIVGAYYMTINKTRPLMLKFSIIFFIISDMYSFIYSIYKWW